MPNFNKNRVIRGTFGKVWMNDERLANIKKFEVKASINYDDMEVNGDLATQHRMMGYSIAGTMTLHKFDSFILKKYRDALKTGVTPDLKLVGALADPSSAGAERISVSDVQLTELTLMAFENKSLLEEEVPFNAGGFDFIDLI